MVIVVFASSGYLEPLLNWLVALATLDDAPAAAAAAAARGAACARTRVVCLDDELEAFLAARGEPCLRLRASRTPDVQLGRALRPGGAGAGKAQQALWLARVQLLEELLAAGDGAGACGVVLSDADAVWRRDARASLAAARGALVATRGSFPQALAAEWGCTVCMGLVYFRPVDAARRVAREMLKRMSAGKSDDQLAVNSVLRVLGVRWRRGEGGGERRRRRERRGERGGARARPSCCTRRARRSTSASCPARAARSRSSRCCRTSASRGGATASSAPRARDERGRRGRALLHRQERRGEEARAARPRRVGAARRLARRARRDGRLPRAGSRRSPRTRRRHLAMGRCPKTGCAPPPPRLRADPRSNEAHDEAESAALTRHLEPRPVFVYGW